MSLDPKNIMNRIKSGKMNLQDLQKNLGASAPANVTLQDWGVCYSSATGELSEYCTVVANSPNAPITGCGMMAYTSDGSRILCAQYSMDFETRSLTTSLGTTSYNPNQGNQILCIVYGWTTVGPYYVSRVIQIVPCQ